MDFKNVVYNAARDGKLRRLMVFLEERKPEEVLMLVGSRTNGATPLVMASRNGHLDVVKYLVDRCSASLEQTGSVVFDGETIEGAPPLWCAAAAGHEEVVRFLVSSGARVNATTRTASTPLRAACFDGHVNIVRFLVRNGADIELANRHGHTCLMIACYKGHYDIAEYLMSLGADVNRKSLKGNTALHDAAESGSLDILKMLLARNARVDVDSYGMTPLRAASVTGHSHVVEYLIKLPNFTSRQERIDALELLGATYVDKKRDMIGALDLWKRAMALRFEEGLPPLKKVLPATTVDAYEHCREKRTVDELDDLLTDPDDMRMQALLVRERILGPGHPDTSYYIRYRGAVYADAGKFSRCVSLWSYALDMQQKMLEPLNPMTHSSLFSFTELFAFIIGQRDNNVRGGSVSAEDVNQVLAKGVAEVEAGMKVANSQTSGQTTSGPSNIQNCGQRTLVIVLQLAALAFRLTPPSDPNPRTLELLFRLVRLRHTTPSGQGPLHLATNPESVLVSRYKVCQLPSVEIVKALVRVGGDAAATDDDGNTPLHIMAKHTTSSNVGVARAVFNTLLAAGAHLDTVNLNGLTAAALLPADVPLRALCDPAAHTTLACLAARALRASPALVAHPPTAAILATLPPPLCRFLALH